MLDIDFLEYVYPKYEVYFLWLCNFTWQDKPLPKVQDEVEGCSSVGGVGGAVFYNPKLFLKFSQGKICLETVQAIFASELSTNTTKNTP